MLQQTALMLVAGLIFLFFFTPEHEAKYLSNPALAVTLMVVLTFLPGLLSYIFGRKAIERFIDNRHRQLIQVQNSRRYAFLFGVFALAGFVFQVYYLQLPVLVNRTFAFFKFENSRALIGIIPLIIAITLTRLSIYELDRQVRNTTWTRRGFLFLNLKLTLLPLFPFAIYLFIGDLINHSPISLRIFLIAHSYIYWIIMLIIVLIMYIKAPSLMRRIWITRSLPAGDVRDRIELLAEKENVKYRDALVWNTAGGNISNAAMTGLLPFSRYVFLTDALLNNFTLDEVETIVAHEFGHIKYKHIPAYLVFSLGYLVFYILIYARFLPVIEKLHLGDSAVAFLSAIVTLFAFFTYFVFIFRFLSRRFEQQADLYAVESTGKPEVFKSALIKLAEINYIPRRLPWLLEILRTHPSIYRRLEFVDRLVRGDTYALKYRRRIFHFGRITTLILLALLLLFIANKDVLFPEDDVHYEMGRQYAVEGMVDKAIMKFRDAARVNPQSERAHYALGVLYSKKGAVEEAIEELKKTLAINPDNVAAREELRKIQDGSQLR